MPFDRGDVVLVLFPDTDSVIMTDNLAGYLDLLAAKGLPATSWRSPSITVPALLSRAIEG